MTALATTSLLKTEVERLNPMSSMLDIEQVMQKTSGMSEGDRAMVVKRISERTERPASEFE